MRSVELGTRITSPVEFTLPPAEGQVDGALADPSVVTVTVRSPAGVDTVWTYPTSAEVVRDAAGTYHVDHTPDAPGVWRYRWAGSGDGPNVVVEDTVRVLAPFDPLPFYGATREGIAEKYLPGRLPLKASVARQIDQLLEDYGARVEATVARRMVTIAALSTEAAADVEALRAVARSVIELAVASLVTDSAYPERADASTSDTSYGSLLWSRYREGLTDLVAELDKTEARAREAEANVPDYSFPETNLATRTMRW